MYFFVYLYIFNKMAQIAETEGKPPQNFGVARKIQGRLGRSAYGKQTIFFLGLILTINLDIMVRKSKFVLSLFTFQRENIRSYFVGFEWS